VFQYELLIDANEPEGIALIGLVDTRKLRKKYNYTANLSGKKST